MPLENRSGSSLALYVRGVAYWYSAVSVRMPCMLWNAGADRSPPFHHASKLK